MCDSPRGILKDFRIHLLFLYEPSGQQEYEHERKASCAVVCSAIAALVLFDNLCFMTFLPSPTMEQAQHRREAGAGEHAEALRNAEVRMGKSCGSHGSCNHQAQCDQRPRPQRVRDAMDSNTTAAVTIRCITS